jgi:hypothetical protein
MRPHREAEDALDRAFKWLSPVPALAFVAHWWYLAAQGFWPAPLLTEWYMAAAFGTIVVNMAAVVRED